MAAGGAAARGTIDRDEVARFEAMAADWWDPAGPARPLHAMNPVRVAFIRDRLAGGATTDLTPLAGLSVLDIGCGGGLLAEPLARLGAAVTGIDAGERAIAVASAHAAARDLPIDYRATTAEALAETGQRFDAVIASEVVEHVADLPSFAAALGRLARPGGTVILTTLNRTWRSFAVAVVGAEYLARLLPRGTHDWRRFLKPSELAAALRREGMVTESVTGLRFDPRDLSFRLAPHDTAVNYLLAARRLS